MDSWEILLAVLIPLLGIAIIFFGYRHYKRKQSEWIEAGRPGGVPNASRYGMSGPPRNGYEGTRVGTFTEHKDEWCDPNTGVCTYNATGSGASVGFG